MAKSRKVKQKKAKKKIEAQPVEPGIKRSGWFVVILGAAGLCICLYLYSFHIELLRGEIKSGPLCGADNGPYFSAPWRCWDWEASFFGGTVAGSFCAGHFTWLFWVWPLIYILPIR
jgi:hypothetical protein